MMGITDYILIILSVAFLLFAGFSIPFLLQIWRTAKGMAETLDLLNRGLPAIMKNMEEITTNINRATTAVNREIEVLSHSVRKVQGTVNLLIGLEEIVRRSVRLPFTGTIRTALAVARGVRTFLDHLLRERPEGRA
ncbi:MAG: DUF948 domain-containing protein [Proteobacteria bacterium]|nr:DUF948 domain-containing protein [Pseudomonadota bacterium]MBU2226720.1 DUF948 domain-containing protein [Pseudomonadota bacterium]MBU2261602.1 DUF948 domain-containing protein [Pseudomonadota bacterium]